MSPKKKLQITKHPPKFRIAETHCFQLTSEFQTTEMGPDEPSIEFEF